jgi:hypothetical protein
MSTDLFSHNREGVAMERATRAQATHATPPPLTRRGLQRAKALYCQPLAASRQITLTLKDRPTPAHLHGDGHLLT